MTPHIHIVCAEVPWPPDHSQAIDTLNQLKALHDQGMQIHLHYFCEASNSHPTELNRYCDSIHPYCNRDHEKQPGEYHCDHDLFEVLSRDNYPVIFEGIYCTGILNQLGDTSRKIIVRMYDHECRHCEQAAKYAGDFLRKMKLQKKSGKIDNYQRSLPQNCLYLFSIPENASAFREEYGFPNVMSIPLFHSYDKITSRTGTGQFCLYHGNLSDPCNDRAAQWLLTCVFNDINTPLVIAGKKPGKKLTSLAHLYSHTCLVANPSHSEMEDLVGKAQMHVLPSFSYKRPELKLVHALYAGRHCIVNENAVDGTGLKDACYTATSSNAFKSAVLELAHRPFEEEEIMLREKILGPANSKSGISDFINLCMIRTS